MNTVENHYKLNSSSFYLEYKNKKIEDLCLALRDYNIHDGDTITLKSYS